MARYRFCHRRGCMVDGDGLPMLNQEERARPLQAPRVFGDYHGFVSPVSGQWIEGRRARRYDMEKHDCVDAANDHNLGGRLKNERFARKWGQERMLDK